MISELFIEGLRGIKKGIVKGFAPLTILVGPNGSGKSTILEALMIGASPAPGDAVGRAISRRLFAEHTSQDFFYDFANRSEASVIKVDGNLQRECTLSWQENPIQKIVDQLTEGNKWLPYSQITCVVKSGKATQTHFSGFAADNSYVYRTESTDPFTSNGIGTRFLDTTQFVPLVNLYSDLIRLGRRREMKQTLEKLIPDFDDVELLTNQNNKPSLYIIKKSGKTVPLSLIGDGLAGFARLAFTLLTRPEPLILLEEPEVHQHPAVLRHTAKLLRDSIEGGRQIVLTTHSLELIDALVNEATEPELDKMALIKLVLREDLLRYSAITGSQVKFERQSIEEDLR